MLSRYSGNPPELGSALLHMHSLRSLKLSRVGHPVSLLSALPPSLRRLDLDIVEASDLNSILEIIAQAQCLPALRQLQIKALNFGRCANNKLGLSVASSLSALPSLALIIDSVISAPSLHTIFGFFGPLPSVAEQLRSAAMDPLDSNS